MCVDGGMGECVHVCVCVCVLHVKTWSWPNASRAVVDFMHQGLCAGRRVSLTVHVVM